MVATCREPVRGGTEAALQSQFQVRSCLNLGTNLGLNLRHRYTQPTCLTVMQVPEGFEYKEQMTWRKLGRLLMIPTNVLVILQVGVNATRHSSFSFLEQVLDPALRVSCSCSQGLFGCLPWGFIIVFFSDHLSKDRGLSVQQATLVLLVLGIGGGIGVVVGGWLGQALYNKRKWSMGCFIGE